MIERCSDCKHPESDHDPAGRCRHAIGNQNVFGEHERQCGCREFVWDCKGDGGGGDGDGDGDKSS